ncbi:MAG: hypothetical protein HZC38_19995 [Chloroflexi bacterium]|nr:hypothetical protein [Chloroflexota bacterium]MBI5079933.1 hypothetical protein [Chloroflexota bacterium]MBI5348641.1 hypothetical protein [Chloroflexota bacterium]MBI5715687.1 hypothetical protein [Chloroflexota bacterium]
MIFSILGAILPPTLIGPVATWAWIEILKRNVRHEIALYWIVVIVGDAAAALFMALNMGSFFPDFGFFACMLIPLAAFLSIALTSVMRKRFESAVGGNPNQMRWYRLGGLILFALQLVTAFSVVIIAPALCAMGWRVCSTFD